MQVVQFVEKGNHEVDKIQSKLDEMTIVITVESVLQYFTIDIDTEDALRESKKKSMLKILLITYMVNKLNFS
ncbi:MULTISPECIES: hypothetical protein [Lysinibacillus]|uniref:Uncharacterized protein n=1 Tax=Lysinibacillus xylanilyticus TaxID=582475 RepID=A0ABV3W1M7_9BACI